jgi:3-phenylpropionate/trans-cinnamate dioxygenase ferredoxin subunit
MSHWIPVCKVVGVDPEDVIGFRHDGVEYAIYRAPDGEFFATAGSCTHEKTLLCDGLVMNSVIECPKHNGQFDYKTGKAMGAPVIVDLTIYSVKVEGGTVLLEIASSSSADW